VFITSIDGRESSDYGRVLQTASVHQIIGHVVTVGRIGDKLRQISLLSDHRYRKRGSEGRGRGRTQQLDSSKVPVRQISWQLDETCSSCL